MNDKFIPIGMRTKVSDKDALVINTCGQNDTSELGSIIRWTWANPTNRLIPHKYHDVCAVSVEALWQGTKLMKGMTKPDNDILSGNWRKNKGRKPIGAYAGPDQPLITSPGEARRKIYVPAYSLLIESWLKIEEVRSILNAARTWPGKVYLRDHDTGQGIDRNGPMSHAWLLSVWLNTGEWPK